VIVYVRSNHLDVDCGLRFSAPVVKQTGKIGTETRTLKEMHGNNKLKEVESYVIRANFYTTMNSNIMPQRVTKILL
jgi:hypothetical protein